MRCEQAALGAHVGEQAVANAAGVDKYRVIVDDVTTVNWPKRLDAEATAKRRRALHPSGAVQSQSLDDDAVLRADGSGCDAALPNSDEYLEVVTDVMTTGSDLQLIFELLSEWTVNVELAKVCMPPATIGWFNNAGSFDTPSRVLPLLMAAVLLVKSALW